MGRCLTYTMSIGKVTTKMGMSGNNKELQKRIQSEQSAIVRTTNDDLVCKDCVQRLPDNIILGNTSKCEYYPKCKPIDILRGGKCKQYVKE